MCEPQRFHSFTPYFTINRAIVEIQIEIPKMEGRVRGLLESGMTGSAVLLVRRGALSPGLLRLCRSVQLSGSRSREVKRSESERERVCVYVCSACRHHHSPAMSTLHLEQLHASA